MSLVRIAAESTLVTTDGPTPANAIRPGATVWVLDRGGQHRGAPVVDCGPAESQAPLARVLTRAGEVLAPVTARLAGAKGRPLPVGEVERGSRRLETLAPGYLPASLAPPRPLEGLDGHVFTLPADYCDAPSLDAALDAAHVDHKLIEAGGWIAARVDASAPSQDAWTWQDELRLLELLTTWPDGERQLLRTRLDDREVRTRIVTALVASEEPYDAQWTPAYRPVECRLRRVDRMPAYTGVVALLPETGPTVTVRLEGAMAIVSDMAYVLAEATD